MQKPNGKFQVERVLIFGGIIGLVNGFDSGANGAGILVMF